ncbi:MAG: hypothetical protein NTW86_09430 [Candidatus Sumerlaeota bacterium]|nr:hypothetical protein [Candidatus Sumerlaeota bacterium]
MVPSNTSPAFLGGLGRRRALPCVALLFPLLFCFSAQAAPAKSKAKAKKAKPAAAVQQPGDQQQAVQLQDQEAANPRLRTPTRVNEILPSPARTVMKLDGEYEFQVDERGVGEREQWFKGDKPFAQTAQVPGALQAQKLLPDRAAEYGANWKDMKKYEGWIKPGWYRKVFQIPAGDANQLLWLKFGGVHPGARVWLNGQLLGEHRGAFVPFQFNVADVARRGADNVLVVEMLEDIPARALGGHYSKYGGMWSGIYRGVEIEEAPKARIADVFMKPDVSGKKAAAIVMIENQGEAADFVIAVEIQPQGGGKAYSASDAVSLGAGETKTAEVAVDAPDAALWSPEHPNLYEAAISLVSPKPSGRAIDILRQRFGMCERRTDGGRILVNGAPFYIRGCGDLCCYPLTYSPPVDREYFRRDLQRAKDFGFNYIRCHSWTPTDEFLDVAEEVGVCIQIETASIGQWSASNQPPARERNWIECVRRLRNHPSVMTYCMGNEGGGEIELKKRWAPEARALDPTRFIITTAHHENAENYALSDLIETNTDLYREKPYFRHEYGHYSSYPDARLAGKFAALNNGTPFWLAEAMENAKKNGLGDLLPDLAKWSQEYQRVNRKYGVEYFRLNKRNADGYTLWLGKDSMYTMGVWDDFGGLKGVSAEEFRQSNGETVVLLDSVELDRAVKSGVMRQRDLYVHHTGPKPIRNARLEWVLSSDADEACRGVFDNLSFDPGDLKKVGAADLEFPQPEPGRAARATLSVALQAEGVEAKNHWDFCAFADAPIHNAVALPSRLLLRFVYRDDLWTDRSLSMWTWAGSFNIFGWQSSKDTLLATDMLDDEVVAHLANGGRVFLVSQGLFEEQRKVVPPERVRTKWATFMAATNYQPEYGHVLGTIIADHPAMKAFPHRGFGDYAFAGLLKGAPALIMTNWPRSIQPIIRAIDHGSKSRSLAYLFETRVGEGKLLVTSFSFDMSRPECSFMMHALLHYAMSDEFQPTASMTADELRAIPRAQPPKPPSKLRGPVKTGFNPAGKWEGKTADGQIISWEFDPGGTFTNSAGGWGEWRAWDNGKGVGLTWPDFKKVDIKLAVEGDQTMRETEGGKETALERTELPTIDLSAMIAPADAGE